MKEEICQTMKLLISRTAMIVVFSVIMAHTRWTELGDFLFGVAWGALWGLLEIILGIWEGENDD